MWEGAKDGERRDVAATLVRVFVNVKNTETSSPAKYAEREGVIVTRIGESDGLQAELGAVIEQWWHQGYSLISSTADI